MGRFLIREDVPSDKWLFIHDVGVDDVREESPLNAIGEDAELRLRGLGEVVGELFVEAGEPFPDLLGLDEEDRESPLEERPIDRLDPTFRTSPAEYPRITPGLRGQPL